MPTIARGRTQTTVTGFRELQKNIDALTTGMQKRIYQKAANAGGKIVKTAAAAAVPIRTGTLRKAITHRVNSKPARGLFGVKITVRGGSFASDRTAHRKGNLSRPYKPDAVERYYRFLETGTKYHPAKPFLLPSLESSATAVLNAFKDALRTGLDAETRRLPNR
jgi:HK97 gp10 family phage protein